MMKKNIFKKWKKAGNIHAMLSFIKSKAYYVAVHKLYYGSVYQFLMHQVQLHTITPIFTVYCISIPIYLSLS